jgi:hypothetical protein
MRQFHESEPTGAGRSRTLTPAQVWILACQESPHLSGVQTYAHNISSKFGFSTFNQTTIVNAARGLKTRGLIRDIFPDSDTGAMVIEWL